MPVCQRTYHRMANTHIGALIYRHTTVLLLCKDTCLCAYCLPPHFKHLHTCPCLQVPMPLRYSYLWLGLARTIYIRCTYGIVGLEITKCTVYIHVYIRFWPALPMVHKRQRAYCHISNTCVGVLANVFTHHRVFNT